ncbi:MAG TPA: biotin/lipoyl-containing protein [Candidatus Angelobacter sp.]|jgi:biotin carboxyl carrier protein|nr:biotin/lipoyl-containing protein [Candidatus Angelobacter sp.]
MIYEVTVEGSTQRVELIRGTSGWRCKLNGREFPVDVVATGEGVLSILINGKSYEIKQETTATETNIVVGNQRFNAVVRDPRSLRSRRRSDSSGEGVKKITAPMPGKVVRILASTGTQVEAGQGILVIEAMKMQNELKSPKKGIIKKLTVAPGAAVDAGQVLAEVE